MSAWAAWSFQPPDTLSQESTLPVFELAVVFICLACGGILKGATGAGAPILAIPAMAAFHDVRFAIVVMTVPNVITNLLQAWQNRHHRLGAGFLLPFLLSAAVGVVLGTWVLVEVDSRTLSLVDQGQLAADTAIRRAAGSALRPSERHRAGIGRHFGAGIAELHQCHAA